MQPDIYWTWSWEPPRSNSRAMNGGVGTAAIRHSMPVSRSSSCQGPGGRRLGAMAPMSSAEGASRLGCTKQVLYACPDFASSTETTRVGVFAASLQGFLLSYVERCNSSWCTALSAALRTSFAPDGVGCSCLSVLQSKAQPRCGLRAQDPVPLLMYEAWRVFTGHEKLQDADRNRFRVQSPSPGMPLPQRRN